MQHKHEEVEENQVTVTSALSNILKMNSPEWFHITLGCIVSIATGASLPVYSILFGSILGVIHENKLILKVLFGRILIFCLGFTKRRRRIRTF